MLRHPNSSELLGYWNRIRGEADVPARAAFDPAAVRKALPYIFILETSDGHATFRLAGTGVCEAHMRELRNYRFSSLWSAKDRRQADVVTGMVTKEAWGAVMLSRASTADGLNVEFETLLLPMLDREGKRSFVIGSMSCLGNAWWLGSRAITEHELASLRLLPTKEGEPFPGAADVIDFPRRPGPLRGRSFGHLTVIEGGTAR
jgi:Uncharacterized protein conserved in bacteria